MNKIFNANEKDVLFGTTRVFLSEKFKHLLDDQNNKILKIKQDALQIIENTYRVTNTRNNFMRYSQTIKKSHFICKNLFNCWNSKINYLKFRQKIEVVQRIQNILKHKIQKRKKKLMKF